MTAMTPRYPFALSTVLLAAAFLAPSAAFADPTWTQIRGESSWTEHATKSHDDAGTVTVLKATIDSVQCWQGTTTVDVAPEYLLEVARDIEGTPKWAATAKVTEAKILSRSGDALEYYQLMDVPGWTMTKDRFWFVRGRTVREGTATIFTWEKLDQGGAHSAVYEEFVAEYPKAIEPPVNAGGWVFTPTGGDTEIRYFICTDAGGEVPDSLQAYATGSTMPDTVGDLVREARKRAN